MNICLCDVQCKCPAVRGSSDRSILFQHLRCGVMVTALSEVAGRSSRPTASTSVKGSPPLPDDKMKGGAELTGSLGECTLKRDSEHPRSFFSPGYEYYTEIPHSFPRRPADCKHAYDISSIAGSVKNADDLGEMALLASICREARPILLPEPSSWLSPERPLLSRLCA